MKFEKVSLWAFIKETRECLPRFKSFTDEQIEEIYNKIQIPTRSTSGSAGYDFKNPFDKIVLHDDISIPTGIKVKLDPDNMLLVAPRSSSGKNKYMMSNTMGIIDSDYYGNESNDGCIRVSLFSRDHFHDIEFNHGDKIAQGIFLPFFITEDDEATGIRTGGHGSTGK